MQRDIDPRARDAVAMHRSTTDDQAARVPRGRARRRRLAAAVVAALALALAAAACAPPGSPGGGTASDVVSATNADRAAAGLGPLAWSDELQSRAQTRAGEIAASGTLVHADLGAWMSDPSMGAWSSLGENLLMAPAGTNGFQAEDTWMASPPHRANLLGAFTHTGVGVVTDGAGRVWMVQLFGTR
jgi:uncharacterized protein YkwD